MGSSGEDRLGAQGHVALAGIGARRAYKEQAFDADVSGSLDHIALDGEVHVDHLGREGLVAMNPSRHRRSQEHVLGLLAAEELTRGSLVGQLQLPVRACDDIRITVAGERATEAAAQQAGVAGDVDAGVRVHGGDSRSDRQ